MKERIIQKFLDELDRFGGEDLPNLVRLEVEADIEALLPWLMRQPHAVKIYWYNRGQGLEIAGIGSCDRVIYDRYRPLADIHGYLHAQFSEEYPGLRYYGGIQFHPDEPADPLWGSFGAQQFILPEIELIRNGDKTALTCTMKKKPSDTRESLRRRLIGILKMLNWRLDEEPVNDSVWLEQKNLPGQNEWRRMIRQALEEISSGDYSKIVLARRTELRFANSVNPFLLIQNLRLLNPDSTYFCFQPENGTAFVGGTPEMLYRRSGNEIYSEAIAGTRVRGRNEKQDEILESELLNSRKDLWEHRLVMDNIRDILTGLCTDPPEMEPLKVLKLSRVQHLCAAFRGKLRPRMNDADIIARLHPTPAVGGYPTMEALSRIRAIEPFRRGWYASPVGWMSRDHAQFAVAIRSALVLDQSMYLYAGAGIVKGSEDRSEWEEINNKVANFTKILHLDDHTVITPGSRFVRQDV